MKKQVSLLTGALFLFVMASMASATSVMLDHFVYDPLNPNLTANSGTIVQTATQTDPTIFGGTRKVTLRWVSGPSNVMLTRPAGAANHFMICDSGFGTVGSWEFDWGNTYAGGSILGDLTNGGGATGFEIAFLGSDAPVDINMTVLPIAGPSQMVTQNAPVGPGVVEFSFASFNTIASFAAIDSIRFDFTAPAAADFAIDYIQTIPEPASMALFGLLGLGLVRRRR